MSKLGDVKLLSDVSLAVGIVGVLGAFFSIPLNTAFVVEFKGSSEQFRTCFANTVLTYSKFIYVLLIIVSAFCFAIIDEVDIYPFYAFIVALSFCVGLIHQAILVSSNKQNENQLIQFFSALISLFGVAFILIFLDDYFHEGSKYFLIFFISSVYPILSGIFIGRTVDNISIDNNQTCAFLLSLTSKVKELFVSGVSGEVIRFVFRLVLYRTSDFALAVYQISLWLIQPVQSLIMSLVNLKIYPMIIDGKIDRKKYYQFSLLLCALVITFILCLLPYKKELVDFILELLSKDIDERYYEFSYFIMAAESLRVFSSLLSVLYISKGLYSTVARFEITTNIVFFLAILVLYFFSFLEYNYLFIVSPLVYFVMLSVFYKGR
ncbi:hypothetical protein V8038_002302 [Vibrio parahaemolyticus]|nr:hypothetical protein [Vibrio parahaemolyticus]EGQ8821004.1 hypothetical protein [Vibrio parahaemolyticus]EGQ8895622.1 hypothetical protein [Vibrio parahaemolyticus]EHR6001046.1 hypothetical protein [Vibrio parahaemolyticus]EJC7120635.1 hypothetical protein [Vibrio parahaemolyticus]